MPKYKYLRIETKPKEAFGLKDIVAQVDVNHLNKKGIEAEWDKLEKKYPKENYISSLVIVDHPMLEFQDEPISQNV